MSDGTTVDFLATIPLLEGREEADLATLARVMRRRRLPEGVLLWHQGDDAREMVFILEGVVSSSLQDAARAFAELEYCGPPDSKYVRRMATFHDFDSLALWGFLTSGSYARCPPGRTLLAEGEPLTACSLTINGAVEKVLVRGDRRIRVGLAGPGKAFGYESLIDGRPSPVTACESVRRPNPVGARSNCGRSSSACRGPTPAGPSGSETRCRR